MASASDIPPPPPDVTTKLSFRLSGMYSTVIPVSEFAVTAAAMKVPINSLTRASVTPAVRHAMDPVCVSMSATSSDGKISESITSTNTARRSVGLISIVALSGNRFSICVMICPRVIGGIRRTPR